MNKPAPVEFNRNIARARVTVGNLCIDFFSPRDTGGEDEVWMVPPQQITLIGITEAEKLRDFLTESIEFTKATKIGPK